ncbi:hypothetical protein F4779DRAFT_581723 [Xylariaceae sp. FL0662B]|nr:hypothetical protein F4779DRAFT_581723 [Xylariaceae sp. FL0662B]
MIPEAYNVFNSTDQDLPRPRRKLISRVTERSIRTFEPIMTEQVDISLRQSLIFCS